MRQENTSGVTENYGNSSKKKNARMNKKCSKMTRIHILTNMYTQIHTHTYPTHTISYSS